MKNFLAAVQNRDFDKIYQLDDDRQKGRADITANTPQFQVEQKLNEDYGTWKEAFLKDEKT